MAKGKVNAPFDSVTGTLWGSDRTIGRDPGNASSFQNFTNATAEDKSAGYTTKIISQVAPTRGGSAARHSRAELYCDCDHAFALISKEKMTYLEPWWRAVMENKFVRMSNHSIWMKLCLKRMAEMSAWTRFCFCARYRVANNTSGDWTSEKVVLDGIDTFQTDGQDLEVYKLLAKTTVKNRITYDPLMIDYRLVHEVTTRGEAIVTIPSLQQGSSMLVDVYSYYRGPEDGA